MYKVKLDGEYLYHPWDKSLPLSEGKLTQELNKNGTFDFSIPFTHALASSIRRRKSIVEVIRFKRGGEEETIYRGCCMNDTGNTGLELEVETDGDLVFLQDSIVRPFEDVTTTPEEYFRWLVSGLDKHNDQVDVFKRFTVGTVTVTGESEKRRETGYSTTREAVDKLVERYGGYIRTRTEGSVQYIDYLSSYGDVSGQAIQQGENIIDITKYVNTDDLATRIIPIGAASNDALPLTIESVNNGIDYIQDDIAVSEFGIITRIVEFSDIQEPLQLLAAGQEYLENVKGVNLTVELTAVDLADAGYDIDAVDVGDLVPCVAHTYGIDTQMQVSKKVTDILNPANSRITLGSTIRTLTQKQLNDNASILPMVRQAVSTAGDAAGSVLQVASGMQDIQQQVDVLKAEIPDAYIHPSYTPRNSGLYKITVDDKGHVSSVSAVSKSDITGLGIPSSDTNTHYLSKIVVGASALATSDTTVALTNGNVYLVSVENGAVRSAHKISGSGNVTVTTDADGNIVISCTDSVTATEIQAQLNAKAPKNHASSATTYGAASASYYGHAKASTTTPKAPGTAAVGGETAAFARGDHVHPLPITDVTSKFTWTNCANYKAYKIGNVVFFRAEVTAKSTSAITVATTSDTTLKPSALTSLLIQFGSGADVLKRGICWAYTDGTVKVTTLAGWTSTTTEAISGNAFISGQWFVA